MQLLYCFTFFILLVQHTSVAIYHYDVEYYDQKLDHFNFQNNDIFQQKYLISKEFWNPENGAIFFYPGNEGSIETFCNNTGFMWELAPEFSALLVFAEHRYYGDSVPEGNASFSDYYSYLSSVQALADFAQLLAEIRHTVKGADKVPIIAFGGSYGGMLAAWMRLKYPNIIEGAIASSAPMMQLGDDDSLCGSYSKIVTQDFYKESPECVKSVRKSWEVINKLNTTDGRSFLSETFHLCEPLNSTDDVNGFKDFLKEIYNAVAMVNYPQANDFIAPLPAWPIKQMCYYMNDSTINDHQLMEAINDAVSVYTNYTGLCKCNDLGDVYGDVDLIMWEYQECTELVIPSCSNGVDDMFEPAKWDLQEFSKNCNDTYEVFPDPSFVTVMYGGDVSDAASNIVYSNGDLDPWSGGAVTKSPSDSVVLINIKDGAHHLDLRASQPNDPPSVVAARNIEKDNIRKWIKEFKKRQ